MATTNELQLEVLDYQFNANRYGARIIKWLDQGQKRILREADIRTREETATLTTTAADRDVALPTDYGRLISLNRESTGLRIPFSQITIQQFDKGRDDNGRGVPTSYAISESQILLHPIPDAVYSLYLRYWQLPETLSITSDPVIPEDYQDLLVQYAVSRAFAAEHDYEASKFHRNEFEEGISKLRGELQYQDFQGPRQVAGTWSNLNY